MTETIEVGDLISYGAGRRFAVVKKIVKHNTYTNYWGKFCYTKEDALLLNKGENGCIGTASRPYLVKNKIITNWKERICSKSEMR